VAPERRQPLLTIAGQVPEAGRLPPGCAFHPRCPVAIERCQVELPAELTLDAADGWRARCHLLEPLPPAVRR
jgi:oligopeptide/dipeptide ABC transporter ATP-binding protein